MKYEFDIEVPDKFTKLDFDVFKDFVFSEHKNVCFTYDTKYEAQKRRACFRTWLGSNKIYNIATSIEGNKLYCVKISEGAE